MLDSGHSPGTSPTRYHSKCDTGAGCIRSKSEGGGRHEKHYGNGCLFTPDRKHPECDIGAGCIRSESDVGWVGRHEKHSGNGCLLIPEREHSECWGFKRLFRPCRDCEITVQMTQRRLSPKIESASCDSAIAKSRPPCVPPMPDHVTPTSRPRPVCHAVGVRIAWLAGRRRKHICICLCFGGVSRDEIRFWFFHQF